ncbi:MAG: SDR family oxidoreductase [Burkholderiales bacterium]|nr:SDR family oxidoreductase [Burkholderiales bacterium]
MYEYFPIDRADYDGPVLITGAGGCIGSWAMALLSKAGIPAVAFDLTEDKRRPSLLLSKDELGAIRWLTGDVSDYDVVMKAVEASRATAIVHLAALQVPFCKADPVAGAKVNVVGTVNIFEAARKLGIRRLAYASSIAAHGAMEGHGTLPTLYGAYKFCNEETAKVYSQDWGVHSVGLRPGVVYGVGRDQGMTSKTTVAILAAAAGQPYTVPFTGPVSWLHAGEVASGFLKAVSKVREGAPVFDINGIASDVESSLAVLGKIAPGAAITSTGAPLPFPMALSDAPVRAHLGDYGSVPLEAGIRGTYEAFRTLLSKGQLNASSIS